MRTLHTRSQALALALGTWTLASGWATGQTLIDPNAADAPAVVEANATEEPARRRSILRRDRRTDAEPPAAAATTPASEAPAYTPSAGALPPATAAPATQFPDQPATYAAPVGRPYLGITFDMRYPNAAVVKAVAPGGPAAQSGIRPGDAIHAINKRFVTTWQDVVDVVASLRPGDQLDISYSRRVEERTQVILSGRDADGPQTASYGAESAPAAAQAPTLAPSAQPAAQPAIAPTPALEPAAADGNAASRTPPAAGTQTPAARNGAARAGQNDQSRTERPTRQRGLLRRRG